MDIPGSACVLSLYDASMGPHSITVVLLIPEHNCMLNAEFQDISKWDSELVFLQHIHDCQYQVPCHTGDYLVTAIILRFQLH